jgi:hypothetical protein
MAVELERPRRLGERGVVSPQNPVLIRTRSGPRPDLPVLRRREVSYSREHPLPADVLLAVEVALAFRVADFFA